MLHWCYLLAGLSALGSWPSFLFSFFFFFCSFFSFRKTSSWPRVWNYTPGSKQGRLTEKKTAVRQWITVLWPDKCLFWGVDEEAGSASRITHTRSYTLSHVQHIRTYCMHTCPWGHTHREATAKLEVEPLFLSGPTILSQHNINTTVFPTVYKHSCVQCYSKILKGEGEKNLRLSKNAVLFLVRALKGLYGSLWQQRGFAMQTAHILRLTPVNRAGSSAQPPQSLLQISMLPQSRTWLWGAEAQRSHGTEEALRGARLKGSMGNTWVCIGVKQTVGIWA